MNKYILVPALFVMFLSSCTTVFPYKPRLIGIAENDTMVVEKDTFNTLKRFYVVMAVKEIEPLPLAESEIFERMKPIVEKLIASKSVCSNGFIFLENSFNLYEGAKLSATIECL